MQSEIKTCQNCKNSFTIDPEDFEFYKKIDVPPPTFCPDCRVIRRMCWRNEMSLYKRKCDVPGHTEMLVSIYHPDTKVTVYDLKYWWSDDWDPLSYGQEYDFSKPFFEQWKELRNRFPLQCVSNSKAVNSDYCNVSEESNDSYMCSASWKLERAYYANRISEIKDSSDLYVVHTSELCYEDVLCSDGYKLFYSFLCKSCVDSYFLYDCHNCTNCFGCSNLRNKSYCMWNEQLTREEYQRRLAEMHVERYTAIVSLKEKFKVLCKEAVHKFSNQIKSVNSTGDNLMATKNCTFCFDVRSNLEDCKYTHWTLDGKELYDCGPGAGMGELMYEAFDTGLGNSHTLFTSVVYSGSNVEYSFNCYGSSNIFGCIGIRNKNYCILNKQYSKEEYEALVPKIKKHMQEMPYKDSFRRVYGYGEFFPMELSPFVYNETVAQDYFPKTHDQILSEGYSWREKEIKDYQITLAAKDIADTLPEVQDSITQEIIGCLHEGKCNDRCAKAYRITPDELNLYRRLGIPLPRLCFGCRHDARLRMRNPMKLWHRSCMCGNTAHDHEGVCKNEFETSFAPERKEKVYCESCYQKEVL